NRLRHGPEESERMDVAIDPGLSHGRRIGPHIAGIAMRKVEHEEVRLPLHAANHHHRLAKVSLRMAGRMRQQHEHFLATLLPLAYVVLDDRVAASKPTFVTKPVEHPLGRMALLAWRLHVFIEPMIDGRYKRLQLGPSDR